MQCLSYYDNILGVVLNQCVNWWTFFLPENLSLKIYLSSFKTAFISQLNLSFWTWKQNLILISYILKAYERVGVSIWIVTFVHYTIFPQLFPRLYVIVIFWFDRSISLNLFFLNDDSCVGTSKVMVRKKTSE